MRPASIRKTSSLTPQAGASLTRDRLIREALKLLAREGLNGVSLRRIVKASGAANSSALLYHFGSREALVREIAQMVQAWLEPRALTNLEGLVGTRYTVRQVLEAAYGPVIEMLVEPRLGRDAVRFIARLAWDFGPEGQDISAEIHRHTMQRTAELLEPLLPGTDTETLRFRLVMTMSNVWHGLAERSYLWHSPFGALKLARREQGARLQQAFLDYLEAGVRN